MRTKKFNTSEKEKKKNTIYEEKELRKTRSLIKLCWGFSPVMLKSDFTTPQQNTYISSCSLLYCVNYSNENRQFTTRSQTPFPKRLAAIYDVRDLDLDRHFQEDSEVVLLL